MKKRLISIISLCIATSACATIDTQSTSKSQVSGLQNYSTYIAAAISSWIVEEAQDKQLSFIRLQIDKQAFANSEIEQFLQTKNIKITNDKNVPSLKVSYWVSELDGKILIRIKTNDSEATRLFSKSEGNSIIPASPLTIRPNHEK
ncbi:MAG: hypothetical protein J0L55_00570 [Caulobacterales bacterium]|nr:hypothetical protein [Caulobacterales bacterium]MCA0372246.1 hypothetical protein [Pseudomonadota bacterium]